MRADHRQSNELRKVNITPHFNKYAEGSVFIEFGETKVICTATVEDRVPSFLKGQGKGWITAEYSMLPRATQSRNQREAARGKLGGRTMEIQRLIGRSLRSIVDLSLLGEKTITLDCDVIQADGGTRTTSITGAFVALAFAMHKLMKEKKIDTFPLTDFLASVSVGIVDGRALLDLCYIEDVHAEVDMNIVQTGQGSFVEIQGTGEETTFSRQQLNEMLELAEAGIASLVEIQKDTLGEIASLIGQGVE